MLFLYTFVVNVTVTEQNTTCCKDEAIRRRSDKVKRVSFDSDSCVELDVVFQRESFRPNITRLHIAGYSIHIHTYSYHYQPHTNEGCNHKYD